MTFPAFSEEPGRLRRVDPAAWGDDHVGKPLPAYITGDECLFCHRETGTRWGDNRHQLTLHLTRPDDFVVATLRILNPDLARETQYLLGSRRTARFVRRAKEYGKLDLLSISFNSETLALQQTTSPTWDTKTFADRCAGCHTTAVDTATRAFSAVSLDCFVCHGDVDLAHTKDKTCVLLSDKNRAPREVVSICGQCHLRGGKSKSTSLPYPNTFVAGDNLFRDFQVDFSDASLEALPAIDQHIYLNARDIAVFDRAATTCLTCHDVHRQSSEKHQQLADAAICSSCHVAGSNNRELRDAVLPINRRQAHRRICDF
ncbi:MAG: hypothetical protein ABI614_00835 [Planctomycetota bacterium]